MRALAHAGVVLLALVPLACGSAAGDPSSDEGSSSGAVVNPGGAAGHASGAGWASAKGGSSGGLAISSGGTSSGGTHGSHENGDPTGGAAGTKTSSGGSGGSSISTMGTSTAGKSGAGGSSVGTMGTGTAGSNVGTMGTGTGGAPACDAGATRSCWPGDATVAAIGACKPGTQTCKTLSTGVLGWGDCKGAVTPQPESCNGVDDDCNGVTDDVPPKDCSNTCGDGVQICQNGAWSACNAPPPQPETCNGIDDDCNGQIDDGIPSQPCSTPQGGTGQSECVNGQWSACSCSNTTATTCVQCIETNCSYSSSNLYGGDCQSYYDAFIQCVQCDPNGGTIYNGPCDQPIGGCDGPCGCGNVIRTAADCASQLCHAECM